MTDTIQTPSQPEELPQSGDRKSAGRFRLPVILMWVGIISLLALLGWGLMRTNATRPEAGQPAPDLSVEFFNGYEWENKPAADLQDMAGKVVVLNFWASWCVECRLEAELIEQTWRQYAADDVVFLGVAYSDVEPNSIKYLKEFDITYPNAPDLGTDISDDYEITGVPETFFIDKNGEIAHVQIGPLNPQVMNSVINQLLTEEG